MRERTDAARRDHSRAGQAVNELIWQVARQLLGLGPTDPPVAQDDVLPTPAREREVRLAVLAAGEQLRAELDRQIAQAAAAAAAAGADYGELGTAAGITRQGARRRWPGLAEITKEARRT